MSMKEKKKRLEGSLQKHPSYKIYLNISHLSNGNYSLKLTDKNKVIKKIKFKKK